jgi:oligopeptidase B
MAEGKEPAGVARPPVAKKVATERVVHGDRRVDDYGWLRDKSDRDVLAYLKAENEYTAAVMKPALTLRDELYTDVLSRIPQTDESPPYRKGGFWYYTRAEQGKQYPVQCRKAGSLDAAEQVTLDLNALAEGHPYFSVHEQAISDDGRRLAYTTDVSGAREFTLCVKDVDTGAVLTDGVTKVRSLAWAADNVTLFYVTEDAAKRPYRLYRRDVRGGPGVLVYEEADELFRLYVRRSLDGRYVYADSQSLTTTETRVIPGDRPSEGPRALIPRREFQVYHAEHRDGHFYVRTNHEVRDFRLITFPASDPSPGAWRELVPHREGVTLEDFRLFRRHAALLQREGGLPALRVLDLNVGSDHCIDLPERVCAVRFEVNPKFDSTHLRFTFSTPVTPDSVFDYDMESRRLTLLKRARVRGIAPDLYTVERTQAAAPDGARVPITLVYRKDVPRDGSAPALLFGYGAYGAPQEASFDPWRLSLLDRGVTCAVAHVRGGGDLGGRWREQGRAMNKLNAVTDFIAVAEHLVGRKYTSPDRLAVQSLSAGGVVIGQAVNLRPDLFKAVLLRGPFLDVVNSMLDPTLPLTVPEYLEWGDPNRECEYWQMTRFCPYTNLRRQPYPAMLLLTSLDDSQVMYWEPVKYVAKLRALKTDANPLLLQVGVNAGHMGSSGRYDALREKAFGYAFVLSQIGFGHSAPVPPPARDLTASGGRPNAQAAATAARTASSGTPADTASASSVSPSPRAR